MLSIWYLSTRPLRKASTTMITTRLGLCAAELSWADDAPLGAGVRRHRRHQGTEAERGPSSGGDEAVP